MEYLTITSEIAIVALFMKWFPYYKATECYTTCVHLPILIIAVFLI